MLARPLLILGHLCKLTILLFSLGQAQRVRFKQCALIVVIIATSHERFWNLDVHLLDFDILGKSHVRVLSLRCSFLGTCYFLNTLILRCFIPPCHILLHVDRRTKCNCFLFAANVDVVLFEESFEFVVQLTLSNCSALQSFVLLHRLLDSIFKKRLALHFVKLIFLLGDVRIFLAIQLGVEL